MSLGNAYPARKLTPNTRTVTARFTGGGAAGNWTKVYGDGIASVAYNAATGKFLMTFVDVGAAIQTASVVGHNAAGTAPLFGSVDFANLSLSAKTVPVEMWTDAGALADPDTTCHITVTVEWRDNT